VTQRVAHSLRWVPTRALEVVELQQGRGYDGPGKAGGLINTAVEELHYWARVGYGSESPPNSTLQRAEALMRAHPDAVVARIDARIKGPSARPRQAGGCRGAERPRRA
jgi:hypothetical protein